MLVWEVLSLEYATQCRRVQTETSFSDFTGHKDRLHRGSVMILQRARIPVQVDKDGHGV